MLFTILGIVFTLFALPLYGMANEHYRCHPSGDRVFYMGTVIATAFGILGPLCFVLWWPTEIVEQVIVTCLFIVAAACSVSVYRGRTRPVECTACHKLVLDKYTQRRECHLCKGAYCMTCEPSHLLNSLCAACDPWITCAKCKRVEGRSKTGGWVDGHCTECISKISDHILDVVGC